MFDLPVNSKRDRAEYTRFRKALLERGFSMLQFSVYARHCASEESASKIRKEIRGLLPPEGQVRMVAVTDRQFSKMEVYFGEKRRPAEDPPRQIMLF